MRRALALAALLCGCSADLHYPTNGVQYACSDQHPCPNNMTCNPNTQLCEIAGGRARVLGQNCQNGDDCASGNCGDGVCCDKACTGICERCDQSGKAGTCSPTPAGLDPDHECEKAGQHQNCASRCDGAGHCTPIPDGLQCGDCLVCNFEGKCLDCGAFACQNKACLRSCTGPGDCAAGNRCTGGVCVGAKSNGQACGGDGECASSHCVGAICCSTSCDQQPQATCQSNGQCRPDGGGCALYPANSVCLAPSCSGGFLTPQRTCDGSGTCTSPAASACPGDYACNASSSGCGTTCGADADCRAGFFCHGGACLAHSQADGDACNVAADCVSSHCLGSICCHDACADQGAASCGQTGACVASGTRKGLCAFYPQGAQCRAESCTGSTYTAAGLCAGDGTACPAGTGTACANAVPCVGNTCGCTVGTQTGCSGSAWCRLVGGVPSCVSGAQQAGDPCALSGDCSSGHCDHNVCCASGTCCTNVSGCPANSSACVTPGTCSGQNTTWACTSFSCASSSARNDGACNGQLANSCGNFRDSICTSATIQSPSCPTNCAPLGPPDDSLCDTGAYCALVSNVYVCQPKAANGGACTAPNQCLNGTCDTTLHICCSGTNCCNTVADCPASYTVGAVCSQPTQCTGTARVATCTANTCGTASSASRYDGACNYANDSADFYTCPNNFAFYCNGAALQNPAAGCPTDCSFLNEFCGAGCGQFRCDPQNAKCLPGHTCVITNDNHNGNPRSCTGACQ